MKRALILGGTGVLGLAAARRFLAQGWAVEVTGRNSSKMPAFLTAAGARFITSDRHDPAGLARAIGPGAELVIDAACYTAAHAATLLPLLADVDSTVMLSSKAVYVDEVGNHINSATAPHFPSPITESNPTMAPGHGPYQSPEGYGSNKVAAEHVFLDSSLPVTVIRASKAHGAGAANPREWVFVKRALEGRTAVFLAHAGRGADHTTAAANTAALIETIAANPGTRILNSADPDAPTGLEIARAIATHLGHQWQEILLDDDAAPSRSPVEPHPADHSGHHGIPRPGLPARGNLRPNGGCSHRLAYGQRRQPARRRRSTLRRPHRLHPRGSIPPLASLDQPFTAKHEPAPTVLIPRTSPAPAHSCPLIGHKKDGPFLAKSWKRAAHSCSRRMRAGA
ncbi:NAD-dependent epimerase/dehydratase family protein [Paeniglutamicibacter gangotriensis]|uniref:Short chain dehydrogenase n=1 Tax=Paeniglutamicibacter gangotriensis Lz1y TaxID=1276920 RepID=M7NDB3_9MICC|nr:NAD-dependent epimerase/dehydratase family protein [Paeniglutamicibacter gangotriensis]EMQ99774.1 short chain dehydrogenase [Paeniglutamicibacter gangotriensis Lz1y]